MPANISYFTHFSGNFWWTRADYWHSLADTIGPDYYDPERFLFTGKPRTACVYYTGFQVRFLPRCDTIPDRTVAPSAAYHQRQCLRRLLRTRGEQWTPIGPGRLKQRVALSPWHRWMIR